ncbi:MAG: alpha/beta fold hydrolase [Myxococcota bacterium]|nr:alpha/beta fold hydrolase [Myxococcota bacterium]
MKSPDVLGQHGVGYFSFTAIDSQRGGRSLPVDLWYPVDLKQSHTATIIKYPLAPGIGMESKVAVEGLPVYPDSQHTLLIFSHGYGGISRQSVDLMETLASHGFIVISPEHTGNSQITNTDTFDDAARNRVPDISFLIDTMIKRNRDTRDLLYQRIAEEKVGVLGHSFGGMTAIGTAAGWAEAKADSRVAAIASISAVIDSKKPEDERTSPYGGFSGEQLATIKVPVLLVGGTKDKDVPIENNALAFAQMVQAPRLYNVAIRGANHTHFTNVCSIGEYLIDLGIGQELWPTIGANDLINPYLSTCGEDALPMPMLNRLLNRYVVSFFRHHLLGEAGYGDYLTKEAADRESTIEFSRQ